MGRVDSEGGAGMAPLGRVGSRLFRREWLTRHASRLVSSILLALGSSLLGASGAAGQRDEIRTSGSGGSPESGCVDGVTHWYYGTPERFRTDDDEPRYGTHIGYIAICVGACERGHMWCYRNPTYSPDDFATSGETEIPPVTPIVIGANTLPLDVAGGPPPLPTFKLGAQHDEHGEGLRSGNTVHFGGDGPDGGPFIVVVTVEGGGEAPREAGLEADWRAWYDAWIKLIAEDVFGPVEAEFATDGTRQRLVVDYVVARDGTVTFYPRAWFPGTNSQLGPFAYRLQQRYLKHEVKAPPFPAASRRQEVRRRFIFEHNMGNKGMTLQGPPDG